MNLATVARFSRTLALVSIVLGLAIITYLPTLLDQGHSGDQVLSEAGRQLLCHAGFITGWPLNDISIGTQFGLFAPNLPSFLVTRLSCELGHLLHISGHQAFLVTGIALTVLLTIGASLACSIGLRASLFIGYGLATAPSSFSRIGHIELSQLWPIMPCIGTCAILLARHDYPANRQRPAYYSGLFGLLMGLWSLTAQDYYLVFSILCIVTCYSIGVVRAARGSDLSTHRSVASPRNGRIGQKRWHYTKLAGGYVLMMLFFLASKKLLWQIPVWAFEATKRQAVEQFTYGFWPLNIFTSPVYNWALAKIFAAARLPITETPFWSSSGILVSSALVISLITWIQAKPSSHQKQPPDQALILAFAGVLLATILIACIVATSGGLGTLFAVFVSPQLRALNRITPYFYCASLVVCAIKFDQVLAMAINNKSRGGQS